MTDGAAVDPGVALGGRPDPEVLVALGGPSGPTPGDSPDEIAVDQTHVYFATAKNRIGRVPKDGGALEIIGEAQAEYGFIEDLAVDEDAIYWTEWNTFGEEQSFSLWRQLKDSTTPSQLAVVERGAGLSLHADYVYWLRDERIVRTPRQGGDEEAVLTLGAHLLSLHAGQAALVVATEDAVHRVTDDTAETIAVAQVPYPLLSDADRAYWITAASKAGPEKPGVFSASLAGADLAVVAGCESSTAPYAVDEAGVYCFVGSETIVWAVPGAGTHEPIWMREDPSGPQPTEVVTDASWVYWSSLNYGVLIRAAK